MPIDPRIPLEVKPMESPLVRQGRALDVQNAKQRLAEGAQQLEERANQLQDYKAQKSADTGIQQLLSQKPDTGDDVLYSQFGARADKIVKMRRAARLEEINAKGAEIKQQGEALTNFTKIHGLMDEWAPKLVAIQDPDERRAKLSTFVNDTLRSGAIQKSDADQFLSDPLDDTTLNSIIGQSPKIKAGIENQKLQQEVATSKLKQQTDQFHLDNAQLTKPNAVTGLTPVQQAEADSRAETARIAEDNSKRAAGTRGQAASPELFAQQKTLAAIRRAGAGTESERANTVAYGAYSEQVLGGKPVAKMTDSDKLNAVKWAAQIGKPPAGTLTTAQRSARLSRIHADAARLKATYQIPNEDDYVAEQKAQSKADGIDLDAPDSTEVKPFNVPSLDKPKFPAMNPNAMFNKTTPPATRRFFVDPKTKHRIYSDDGTQWFDAVSGKPIPK